MIGQHCKLAVFRGFCRDFLRTEHAAIFQTDYFRIVEEAGKTACQSIVELARGIILHFYFKERGRKRRVCGVHRNERIKRSHGHLSREFDLTKTNFGKRIFTIESNIPEMRNTRKQTRKRSVSETGKSGLGILPGKIGLLITVENPEINKSAMGFGLDHEA
ncbi:hypothetical protein SDC9_141203 [bioreactor metagenome]|uniref:Uncharacterized protein n=1 Tax=bioreactor metagenome TaxID=1076179 RepID=A0A645DX12_9ZZZZ